MTPGNTPKPLWLSEDVKGRWLEGFPWFESIELQLKIHVEAARLVACYYFNMIWYDIWYIYNISEFVASPVTRNWASPASTNGAHCDLRIRHCRWQSPALIQGSANSMKHFCCQTVVIVINIINIINIIIVILLLLLLLLHHQHLSSLTAINHY